jgi:hypothetical protein
MLASVVAGLLLLQAQAFDKIVVTTAPPLDTQRLADALRVYLSEFGIEVEIAAPDETSDLRQRIAVASARACGRWRSSAPNGERPTRSTSS